MSDTPALPALMPAPTNPAYALIEKALDKGMAPAEFGKLVELAEHLTARRAVELYATAMNAAQAEMPVVVRDAQNQHTRSTYATLEAVQSRIKPCYTKHGFSLSFGTADSPLPEHVRIVCDVVHAGGHKETKHADIPLDGKGAKGGQIAMNACQATGSTMTYGQRYLTCLIFNVTVADQDNDGQDASERISEEQALELRALVKSKKLSVPHWIDWLFKMTGKKVPEELTVKEWEKSLDGTRRLP